MTDLAHRAEQAAPNEARGLLWPCGHQRTPENTKAVRAGKGVACRACFRERDKVYRRRVRAIAKATGQGESA